MTITTMPLTELTRTAIHLLCQEIGVVNTARFLNQFTTGYGDYTAERDTLIGNSTVDTILTEIQQRRSASKP